MEPPTKEEIRIVKHDHGVENDIAELKFKKGKLRLGVFAERRIKIYDEQEPEDCKEDVVLCSHPKFSCQVGARFPHKGRLQKIVVAPGR